MVLIVDKNHYFHIDLNNKKKSNFIYQSFGTPFYYYLWFVSKVTGQKKIDADKHRVQK